MKTYSLNKTTKTYALNRTSKRSRSQPEKLFNHKSKSSNKELHYHITYSFKFLLTKNITNFNKDAFKQHTLCTTSHLKENVSYSFYILATHTLEYVSC